MFARQDEEEIMIVGGHIALPSRDEKADKAFFREVLKFPHVDAGGGFLLFALPPSEFAVHDSDEGGAHEFYLMCEDMDDFVEAMADAGIAFDEPANRGWGTLTSIVLPGGGKLGVYQPHHARPHKAAKAKVRKKVAAKKTAKKGVKRASRKAAGKARRR
jgi:catechol 2,3-dioxygenase-like lactoylglutathione lyase family enzyme